MPLNSNRKIRKCVPLSDAGNQLSQVQNLIPKDDLSAFTVDKWRSKIFTDSRVRAKLKDRNYRVKIIEDVELTRIAVEKCLQLQPGWEVDISEVPLSVGIDNVIFSARLKNQRVCGQKYYSDIVNVKVWNKSGKQLLESKKTFYENDIDFMEEVNKSTPAEFQNLWAEREMKRSQQFRKFGIPCQISLFSHKNILLMEDTNESTLSDVVEKFPRKMTNNEVIRFHTPVLKTMKEMYSTLGLVSFNLNETNISYNGLIYDVGDCVSKSHHSAMDILFQNCQNIYSFFIGIGKCEEGRLHLPSAHEMFVNITGFQYAPLKISPISKFQNSEEEITKKAERKSERSRAALKQ